MFTDPNLQVFCTTKCTQKKQNCQTTCTLQEFNQKYSILKTDQKRPPCPRCGTENPKRGSYHRYQCLKCSYNYTYHPTEPTNPAENQTKCRTQTF